MPSPDDLLQDMRDRLEAARKRKAAEYKRGWYLLHREDEIARTLKWREKNRDRYNAYQREYNRRRREARSGEMD